jgi:hypothetical protein
VSSHSLSSNRRLIRVARAGALVLFLWASQSAATAPKLRWPISTAAFMAIICAAGMVPSSALIACHCAGKRDGVSSRYSSTAS